MKYSIKAAKNAVWMVGLAGSLAGARDVSDLKLRPIEPPVLTPIPGHGPGTPGGEGPLGFEPVSSAPRPFDAIVRCFSTDAFGERVSLQLTLDVPDANRTEGLNAQAKAIRVERYTGASLAEHLSADGYPVHFAESAKGVYVEFDAKTSPKWAQGPLKIKKALLTGGEGSELVTDLSKFHLKCQFAGQPPVPGKK